MVETSGLENRRGESLRGFESHLLRRNQKEQRPAALFVFGARKCALKEKGRQLVTAPSPYEPINRVTGPREQSYDRNL